MIISMILLVILAIVAIWYIATYNSFVRLRTESQESWSQIDVQLQRRNDLIPNLVSTVKGYSKYEAGTLAKVTGLRSAIMNAGSHQEAMDKSNQLTATLKSLFAVNENYPELKANTEYQQLMEELANTENKIAYSRQLYNSVAASMNAKRQSFPSNLVAKFQHFDAIEYLKAPEAARTAPKVEF